jgi:hypothetical protein
MARFAVKESLAHLTKALDLLNRLPENPSRNAQEIDLQVAAALPLIVLHGYASEPVAVCASRAKQLCDLLEDHPARFAVQRLLWNSSMMRQTTRASLTAAQELMTIAREGRDRAQLATAHRAFAFSLFIAGEHSRADAIFAEGSKLADSIPDSEFEVFGENPRILCLVYGAHTRVLIGFPDQGAQLAESGIARARARQNPKDLAWALVISGNAHMTMRDTVAVEKLSREAIELSNEHRLPQWLAVAQINLGQALSWSGAIQAGIEFQEQGIQNMRSTGSSVLTSRFRAYLAESYLILGDLIRARTNLAEARNHFELYGEGSWEVELERVEALLLRAEGAPDEAVEHHLHTAMQIARVQGARFLELRAASALAHHWDSLGKRKEARQLLTPIHCWFTEGFSLRDLKEAKGLLEVLK